MLNIAQLYKYYVNLTKIGRIANILDVIDVLWYNMTKLLKNKGLHKAKLFFVKIHDFANSPHEDNADSEWRKNAEQKER